MKYFLGLLLFTTGCVGIADSYESTNNTIRVSPVSCANNTKVYGCWFKTSYLTLVK
jgi:hypothetical protein